MSYTEQSLKSLTVVKLKEILAAHSLSVTGTKNILISRILESNLSDPSSTEEPTTTTTLDPTGNGTDEPDGEGVGAVQELGPAAATEETVTGETETNESSTTAEVTEEDKVVEEEGPSAEELERARQERLKQEEEKRAARLARFGGGVTATPENGEKEGESEEAKKKRAERFGLPVEEKGTGEDEQQKKLNKSMDLLDKPLGSNRRERKPKTDKPAPTSKTNPKGEKTVAEKTGNPKAAAEPAAAAAAAALTPEQQKRLAEDEEKKKKRAARFGAPESAQQPQEKKTKTD